MRRLLLALAVVMGLVGFVADPAGAATGRVTLPFSTGFEGGSFPIGFDWSGCAGANAAATTTAKAHSGSYSLAWNSAVTTGDCFMVWNPYGVTTSPSYGTATGGTPIFVSGHTYQVGMWLWTTCSTTTHSQRLVAGDSGGTGYVAIKQYSGSNSIACGSWQYVEWIFSPSSGTGAMYFRFYHAQNGASFFVDDIAIEDLSASTTASGGGSTCGGPGQPACRTNLTDDDGGFFGGISSGIGSVLSSPLTAIKDAVTSMGDFIVDGFASLLMPSSGTTSGLSGMWTVATSKFPFSVITELVSLPATFINGLRTGVAAGPPTSSCDTEICSDDVAGAINGLDDYAPLATIRNIMGGVLLVGFGYGVLRAIGATIK